MDCADCAVPQYGKLDENTGFCEKCLGEQLRKNYCVTVHEQGQPLQPFIVLDDGSRAVAYAEQLERRGVASVVLSWSPEKACYSVFSPA